jgi:hypothetical protein
MAIDYAALIQGKKASDIELRVAISLDKFKWEYTFQSPALGGRQLRGGTVIDFLVETVPLPTPLYIQGEHFHSGINAERDKFMQALLASASHGSMNPPEVLFGDQLQTQEDSDMAVLKLFGRAQ